MGADGVVGVVDCGRARWKVSVWSQGPAGPQLVHQSTFEVGTALTSATTAELSRGVLARYGEAVSRWIVVSGHVGRENPEIFEPVASMFGVEVRTLDGEEEGDLLRRAVVASSDLPSSGVLVDVGGGSIQLCRLPEGWRCSAPLGTHTLESSFEMSWQSSEADHLRGSFALTAHMARLLADATPEVDLVVGSNQMAAFFSALTAFVGYVQERPLSPGLVAAMYRASTGLSVETYDKAFPANPSFMYGAANCLAVVLATAAVFRAERIWPTDLGLAAGLAIG